MSVPFTPSGTWTAIVTPFGTSGRFDASAYDRVVAFQIDQGIEGLVPCGTTGESPTLDWDEHDAVIERAVEKARGRVGVLAGTGSNATDEAIHGTRHAKEAGASAALIVDCYYNGPSSLELRVEYYERILAAVSDLPLVPYVIPGRTGCALSAADLAYLHRADPKRVPAVKQATGDLTRMRADRTLAGPGLSILSGDDDITLSIMRDEGIRASGAISVMANIVPKAMGDMVRAQANGDDETALRIQAQIAPLLKLVGCAVPGQRELPGGLTVEVVDKFRNPVPVKTMMAGLGMIPAGLRSPLGPMTAAGVAAVRLGLQQVHEMAPEVLAPIADVFEVDIAKRLADDDVWNALVR